ncbi:MAG: carbon monoxide dehydrogenase accessory protein CooC [Thermodesulfovibrionales bacterium]
MKIAITGKGGVGKTTLSAVLAHIFASEGKRVIAVDADPDANLPQALGIPADEMSKIIPIGEMQDLIEERTGAKRGQSGGIFRLNPKVDDIADIFGYRFRGINVIMLGRQKSANAGCYCPENVLLKRFLRHLITERDEVVIVDMEAGIEHMTRGTAEGVDAFVVVVEPGRRSIQTAKSINDMARALGVKDVFVVVNKIRTKEDLDYITAQTNDLNIIGYIHHHKSVVDADMCGQSPFDVSKEIVKEVQMIKDNILSNEDL